jgi:hypothetical protein
VEGRRPRRPQEYRAQGTVPLPQGSHGRDRVLAVRKNIGHAGPCLSRAIATVPGTVRNRPGRDGPHPGGPQGKAEHRRLYGPCNHTRWPGALASSTGWEGRRPRRPQEYRAQRTVPLPQGSHGRDRVLAIRKNIGHVGPCPSRTLATLLEAVRIGQAGMDRVLAVRWKAPVIACQSQAGVPATRLVAAGKGCRTLCRAPTGAYRGRPA